MREVWYKKYRPRNVEDYVFKDGILKEKVNEWIDKKFFGNILLLGEPGTGKTSLAKLLVEQCGFDDADVRYISASLTNGIDDIRDQVVNFAERSSFGMNGRVVVMDECLEENERIRIGTLDDWKSVALNELEWGTTYPTVSFNMETGEFENDTCMLVSDKEDSIYEVKLECGRKVLMNAKHPMIVHSDGEYKEKTINDGLLVGDSVVIIDADTSKIESIREVGKGRVMDVTVHKNHTIVSENGIVTHNCDYLTPNAQAGVRNIIGEVNAQFILIGNYPHKIIPALKSRCMPIMFEQLGQEEFLMRMINILDMEGVTFDNDTLMAHYDTHYPDLRKTINSMEMSTVNKTLTAPISESTSQVTDWMQLSMVHFADGNTEEGRKVILDNITYEDYDFFYQFLYENTATFAGDDSDKRDACIIAIADSMVNDTMVGNREINLSACLARLGRIYRK